MSFILIPLFFPAYGIYLSIKGKMLFKHITGFHLFIASILVLVVWLYPFVNVSAPLEKCDGGRSKSVTPPTFHTPLGCMVVG